MNRFFFRIFLVTLSLLMPAQLYLDAGESSPILPTPDAPSFPMDNVPSTIVNGSVNVVTGDYCESSIDLFLDGPEPISISRTHSSSTQTGSLNWGWNSSHDCRLLFFDMDHSDKGHHSTKWNKAYSQEPSGSGVFFLSEGKGMKRNYKLDIGKHGKGLTNCSSGEISAKTNMKNINLKVIPHQSEAFEMLFGDGAKRIYKRCEDIKYYHQDTVPINEYLLCSVNFPSGSSLSYQYGGRRELFKISVGKDGRLFREVSYENNTYDPSRGRYTAPTSVYSADNGKRVEYFFAADPEGQKFNPLTKVVSSDKPDTFYTYHQNKVLASYGKIHRRTQGNKREGNDTNERYLETEYYCLGVNNVGDTTVEISSKGGAHQLGRVMLQKAPVGPDGAPQIVARYFYKLNPSNDKRVFNGGWTEVFDAQNNQTNYFYDKDERLTGIDYLAPNKKRIKGERFYWGKSGGPDEGNLINHAWIDSKGNVLRCKIYTYKNNNIIKESLHGNLTGQNTNFVKLDAEGNIGRSNRSDSYEISYTYSRDGLNLLRAMQEGNGTYTSFDYKEGTNLLEKKLVYVGRNIQSRHFYKYDANSTLVETIVDDSPYNTGSEVFEKASERKGTFIRPRTKSPGFGQKEWEDEYYYDFATKKNKILKRTLYVYGEKDRLVRKEVYHERKRHHTVSYAYDEKGRVVEVADSRGKTWGYRYDANGNKTFSQSPSGVKTTYTYDNANRLIQEVEKSKVGTFVKHYGYDFNGNRVSSEDEYGNVSNYTYDSLGRLIIIEHPTVPDVNGRAKRPSESFAHDELDNITDVLDSNGYKTKTRYTFRGQAAEIIYPDGSRELFEYNYDGSLKKKTEKDGSYFLFERDYQGRATDTQLYSSRKKLHKHTKAKYTAFNLLSYTDAEGNHCTYEYDGQGRLLVERQGEKSISYTYDAVGHCCHIERKFGTALEKTTVEKRKHDPFGRLTLEMTLSMSGEKLRKIAYDYDINDNLIESIRFTDNGKVSERILYNQRNEPVSITDECDHVTKIVYDYRHCTSLRKYTRSKTETDPNGRVSVTTVDALNRVENCTSRGTNGKIIDSFTYRYDARGNKVKEFHNVYRGNKKLHTLCTEWKYGPCDRLDQLTEAVGTKDQRVTSYAYNRAGQLWKTSKANGVSLSRSYDPRGLLSSIVSSDGTVSDSYGYDKEDNLRVLKDNVHNRETCRDYDSYYRVSRECLDNGLESHYDYDLLDRILSVRLPDGSSIEYEYDAAYLQKVSRKDSQGKEIYDHQYLQYDLSGRLGKEQGIGNGGEKKYTRDKIGRCVSFKSQHMNWNIPSKGFDKVGNLQAIEVTDSCGSYEGHYSYDENYHLNNESGVARGEYEYDSRDNRRVKNGQRNWSNFTDALVKDASFEYTYDACGNLIKKSSASSEVKYRYDAYDRLIEVCEADNLQVLFEYDGLHRRTRKKTFAWNTDSSSWDLVSELSFLYQGEREIAAVDTTGKIVELRILGRGTDIGTAVSVELDGKAYLPVHDHRGSIAALVDTDTNTVVESYRHNAFGEEQIFNESGEAIEQSQIGNPWRYSSKRLDEETGLIFFGLRYYMPETGRWITRDPAGYVDGPNLYAYVHGNPMRYCDPYGLLCEDINGKHDPIKTFRGIGKSVGNFCSGVLDFVKSIPSVFADPSCDPEKSIKFAENTAAKVEAGTAYIQQHGVGGCLKQAGQNSVNKTHAFVEDYLNGDEERQAEIVGGVALSILSGRVIYKGFKWLGRLGEALGTAIKGEAKIPWKSWNKYSKVTINDREYAQLGNRLYTRHAVDRTLPSGLGTPAGGGPGSGRSISPNFVEDVICNGSTQQVTVNGVQRTIHTSGTVEVITEQSGQIVITVNPFKG